MTGLLPVIEQLANAPTHNERAAWLLKCPLRVLSKYDFTIRNRLINASFPAGVVYLDDIGSVMSGVRSEFGSLTKAQADVLERAAVALLSACASPSLPDDDSPPAAADH